MFNPGKIQRSYRNMKRYRKIVVVLIKHGFYDFVDNSNLIGFVNLRSKIQGKRGRAKKEKRRHSHWERIRFVLEDLGPAFVKLGQFASTRPDILPEDLCIELGNLLDSVKPFPGKEAIEIVERELKAPINDIFDDFSEEPVSSASISQVHKARLKTGELVAVKVQRKHIKEIIITDFEIMKHLAELLEKHVDGMDILKPSEIIEDFGKEIMNELSFSNELINLQKFYKEFHSDSRCYAINAFKKYSSQRVLTMEFVKGIKISSFASEDEDATKKLIDNLADLLFIQIFEKGFFHADPHPGNILVVENEKICFIDFGQVGILSPRHKTGLCDIIFGLVSRDPECITSAIMNLSSNKEISDRTKLEYQIYRLIEQYAYLPLENINIGNFLNDLLTLVVSYKLQLPSDIYLLMKAMMTLEGAVRKLQPNFDMIKHIEPYVRKLIRETNNPFNLAGDFYKSGIKYIRLFQDLPGGIREIVDQLINKNMRIKIEHVGLESIERKRSRSMNKLSYAIINASLFISGTLLMDSAIPPKFHNISLLGLLTFIAAIVMGCFLVLSLLKQEKK